MALVSYAFKEMSGDKLQNDSGTGRRKARIPVLEIMIRKTTLSKTA